MQPAILLGFGSVKSSSMEWFAPPPFYTETNRARSRAMFSPFRLIKLGLLGFRLFGLYAPGGEGGATASITSGGRIRKRMWQAAGS